MKYRKKPVIIEAVQFTGYSPGGSAEFDHDEPWIWGNFQNGNITYDIEGLLVVTLGGNKLVRIGDYITKDASGTLRAYLKDEFEKKHDGILVQNIFFSIDVDLKGAFTWLWTKKRKNLNK